MKDDPTIERIRKVRHEISETCDHDPRKLGKYYMKYQQKFEDKLIKTPRIAEKTKDKEASGKRKLGQARSIIKINDDFNDPLPDEIIEDFYK